MRAPPPEEQAGKQEGKTDDNHRNVAVCGGEGMLRRKGLRKAPASLKAHFQGFSPTQKKSL